MLIKLRQIEVLKSQEIAVVDGIRQFGVRKVTNYRWRKEYLRMEINQLLRFEEGGKDNQRLPKVLSDLTFG